MSWDFDPPNDVDVANAAGLNAIWDGAKDSINDLETPQLRVGAFNRFHGGKVYRPAFTVLEEAPSVSTATHVYSHATFGSSMIYSSFDSNGGTETASSYTGDRVIVGHPDHTGTYTSGLAKITLPGVGALLGMSNGTATGKISGLLTLGSVQLYDIDPDGMTDVEFMLCFQIKLYNSGTWYTIGRTERFWSQDDKVIDESTDNLFIPCDLTTVFTPADITNETTGDPVRPILLSPFE